ncbi:MULTISPECIES: ecotin family protein [Prochlorococcus]|nr:ecotin family protein [Prochlorococcus marinus]
MQASIQNRIFFGLVVLWSTTVLEPLRAIPRMDLNDYPQPIAGQQRWVIQLPGLLAKVLILACPLMLWIGGSS